MTLREFERAFDWTHQAAEPTDNQFIHRNELHARVDEDPHDYEDAQEWKDDSRRTDRPALTLAFLAGLLTAFGISVLIVKVF